MKEDPVIPFARELVFFGIIIFCLIILGITLLACNPQALVVAEDIAERVIEDVIEAEVDKVTIKD